MGIKDRYNTLLQEKVRLALDLDGGGEATSRVFEGGRGGVKGWGQAEGRIGGGAQEG